MHSSVVLQVTPSYIYKKWPGLKQAQLETTSLWSISYYISSLQQSTIVSWPVSQYPTTANTFPPTFSPSLTHFQLHFFRIRGTTPTWNPNFLKKVVRSCLWLFYRPSPWELGCWSVMHFWVFICPPHHTISLAPKMSALIKNSIRGRQQSWIFFPAGSGDHSKSLQEIPLEPGQAQINCNWDGVFGYDEVWHQCWSKAKILKASVWQMRCPDYK